MSDGTRGGNRLGPARAIEAAITADEATSAWPNRSWPEKTMTAAAAGWPVTHARVAPVHAPSRGGGLGWGLFVRRAADRVPAT